MGGGTPSGSLCGDRQTGAQSAMRWYSREGRHGKGTRAAELVACCKMRRRARPRKKRWGLSKRWALEYAMKYANKTKEEFDAAFYRKSYAENFEAALAFSKFIDLKA